MLRRTAIALALVATTASAALAQTVKVDPRIQPYKKVSGISGGASSIGSDTMNNLMALWLEGFRKYYPNVRIRACPVLS